MKYTTVCLFLFAAGCVHAQTKVDYPSQIKNGPAIIDTAYATLQLGCDAAATQHAVLNVTRSWTNVPTTACNAVVEFVGTSARIQPANGAIFSANGYTAVSRQQVWDTSTTGVVRFIGQGVGSLIYAGNFTTLSGACDTANVAGSPLIVRTPVNVAANTNCAATVQGSAGGSLIPANGVTITLAAVTGGVAGMFNVGSGGAFASSLTSPQTVQSQCFTGGSDYGSRLIAAATLLSGGGGTVDGFSGESGTLEIANGEDIFLGCATAKCTIGLAQGDIGVLGIVSGVAHTSAAIVLRSNNYLTGHGPGKTIISAYNVPTTGDTGFNHVIDTAPGASNVQVTNLEVNGRLTSTDCIAQNRLQNHAFSWNGASAVVVDNVWFHLVCGDGNLLSGDGITASTYSSGEIKSSRFYDQARIAGVSVDSGNGVLFHDNFCDTSAHAGDCAHCEPTDANQWVKDVQFHHNSSVGGGGITCSGFSATISSHFDLVTLDSNHTNGGKQYCDSIPHCKLINFTLLEPPSLPALSLSSWGGEVGPGIVYSTTALASGAPASILIDCGTNKVPSAGLGQNLVHGVILTNASRIGIQVNGCNDTQVINNTINGVCAVAGVARGIQFNGDGTNDNTGVRGVADGNILQSSTGCPTYAIALSDPNNAAGRTGINSWINNYVYGAATVRYRFDKNNVNLVRDTVPVTFANRSTNGNPAVGSWMFCSDCANVKDDSAVFDDPVVGGGHGANMTWEAANPQQTDWRNH